MADISVIKTPDGTSYNIKDTTARANSGVTGVKGNSESSYRTGNVNLTAANVGAIADNDVLLTTNPFATGRNKSLYISKIDNGFYALDKRYPDCVSGDIDGSALTANEIASLFNGDYDSQTIKINNGKTLTLLFDFTSLSWSRYPGYPYGYIYISFYYVAKPASVSARIYNNYASQGEGWHDVTCENMTSMQGSSGNIWRFRNHYYGLQKMEITIVGDTTNSYGYTSPVMIDFHMDRPSPQVTPIVSKYMAETLYYNLTAPKFIGDLQGNASTATNATKVNNHTVNSDVPANAVFTDTTYESKTAASGGTDVSLVTTGEKYTWNNKTSNTGTITGITTTSPLSGSGTSGSVALSHANSGVTAASKGDTSNQTPTWGGTFKVPSGTVNATGHLTAFADHTVTIPSATATSSKAGLMSASQYNDLEDLATFHQNYPIMCVDENEIDIEYLAFSTPSVSDISIDNPYIPLLNPSSMRLSTGVLPTAIVYQSQKGASNGVCPLNATSKIDTTYLPSFKTINNQSLLGSGNIDISGGGTTLNGISNDSNDNIIVDNSLYVGGHDSPIGSRLSAVWTASSNSASGTAMTGSITLTPGVWMLGMITPTCSTSKAYYFANISSSLTYPYFTMGTGGSGWVPIEISTNTTTYVASGAAASCTYSNLTRGRILAVRIA